MPGSRRKGPCLRAAALRRRSGGGEEQLTRRRPAEPPTEEDEEEAAEGGAGPGLGLGLPAGEAPPAPRPSPSREAAAGRGAAESCLHKTPKRSLSRKSRIPVFSSPVNDTDIQQEIFWDPHSPITQRLGNGKPKQSTSRCAVEISEIVNRIAPQDEKAACNEGSLLGTWIGEDAIPCTPAVVKVRARTKLTCTRDLKIKNPEEELMKLAKEFDKNLVELDAVQEQEKLGHDFIRTAPESLNNSKDEANTKNLKSLFGEVSEIDTGLSLKPVAQSTGIAAADPCQASSQKPVDLEAEIALRALFDCSTQKCSGQLSQGLSDVSLNTSCHENKSTLEEEHLPEQIKDMQHGNSAAHHKDTLCALGSVNRTLPKPDTHPLTKKPPSSLKTQLVVSGKLAGVVNDDFDDWDTDFLADDSFVMQITQHPELLSTEEAPALPTNPSVPDFSDGGTTKERSSGNSGACLGSVHKSNSLQFSPLKHSGKNTRNVVKPLSLQKPCKTENSEAIASHGKCDIKPDKISSICKSAQNSNLNYIPASMQSEVKNGNEVEISNKRPLSFDDWNEPKFSDEVLDMFCESDSLWDANCEDDELLYQVTRGLATTSHAVNCKNISSPRTVISGSEKPGSHSRTGITTQALEGSKNQVNVTLHSKLDNKKPPFKRHLSESFALPNTSVSVVEQKTRKCSQEEIERKKQEALARRKSRMQASLKDT
ncbi:ewing's tumor-associated antigen 1 [Patagioenas fasciata monilis]|uniref:Ewing's tumor-associated antigen 1 n=1 Tax=Patagioenas fasciata monilis TaxID=372326 RepID=A0A1V4IGX9_PATFA|nr:ewing's tumor-associated antigen 1 [Patagioenas fasciata monilis]